MSIKIIKTQPVNVVEALEVHLQKWYPGVVFLKVIGDGGDAHNNLPLEGGDQSEDVNKEEAA